jgi:UDP-arabinose 4-epimerase
LVTGGAGYIGSHACKALSKAGYHPISYDNLVHGHEWAVKWGPLERGDILDAQRVSEVLAKYQPVAVMHFAAFAYVGESVENPGKYYHNNVFGSLSLIEAMIRHGVNRIVFSSTCATYGVPDKVPITEESPQNPINPYGASKLMVERILKDFEVAHGLKWIALRYFNAAGADPDGEIGEAHDPETHLIPLVLDAIAGRRPNVSVFGGDYDTRDGTCIRDYIHVTDLANAHVQALRSLLAGRSSQAYNLGNGVGFSVREVVAAAERVLEKRVPVKMGPRRFGDPPRLVANAALASQELGWRPRISSLEEIVETAWRWTQKQTVRS